jgi:large subunit ribosomal protein L1
VTFDVARAVTEIKAGKIDFKVDKTGIVHASVGKMDFGLEKLVENVASFIETIQRLKPPASKGTYYRSISLSSTMGPGVKVDPVYVKDILSR